MYHWNTQVRYSETDENGFLTIPALINYLQDDCSFQSEELQVGVDFLKKHEAAWVISGWQIDIIRMPRFTEEIDVQTWPYAFQGFYGYRNFRIVDETGDCLVRANSLWVQVNMRTGRPIKVLEELTDVYPMGEPLDMEEAPRKMRLARPEEAQQMDPVAVQWHHLDSNHHVNNGQYVQMALEAAAKTKEEGMQIPGRIRVQYKKPALLGDTIYPYVLQTDNCLQVELSDEKRIPYAVVELS